jgi:diguanylate cyclase (GGDEF)-like protein/PAS domain S-box-containing protein
LIALKNRQQTFRLFVEHSADLFFIISQAGLILYANPVALHLLDTTLESIIGTDLRFQLHPEDALRFQTFLDLLPGGYARGNSPVRFHIKGGDNKWIFLEALVTRLPGETAGQNLMIQARDISQRKQAEETLQQTVTELTRSNAFLSTLSQVSERLDAAQHSDQVLDTLGHGLDSIGLNCAVTLANPSTRTSKIHYISIKPEILKLLEQQTGVPMHTLEYQTETRPFPKEWELGEPVYFPDLLPLVFSSFRNLPQKTIERFIRLSGIPPFTPLIYLPLKAGNLNLGDLVVWGAGLQKSDTKALSIFASQVAGTLNNARLLEDLHRRAQEAETLSEAAAILTSALDLEQVLERILTQLERVVPFDNVTVILVEGKGACITASRGLQESSQMIGQSFQLENTLLEQAWQEKSPLILADAQTDSRFKHWFGTKTTRGWMGVPLAVRGELIGFLTLDSNQANSYDPSQSKLVEAFANQAAIAIANARLFRQVKSLAVTDSLTGLFNRRHFFELAGREFERSRRYGSSLSLIMWDIDHFKNVNDQFGHLVGDAALQAVAARCRQQLREADLLGRYGGEEFVALLPETNLFSAAQAAERLRSSISNNPILVGDKEVVLSISLGVAEADASCLDLETLISRVDLALYKAKQLGRNCSASYIS